MTTQVPGERDEGEDIPFELPKPAARRASSFTPKKITTLEDIYASFTVGEGQARLRVTRLTPKVHMGVPIAGWIDELDEPISLSEFRQKYGGGRFAVAVIAPSADGSGNERNAAEIEILIPGLPSVDSLPRGDSEMRSQGYSMQMPMMEPTPVAVERLRNEERREKRQQDAFEKAASATASPHVIAAIHQQGKEALAQIQAISESKAELLREQNQSLTIQVAELRSELKSSQDEILRVKKDQSDTLRKAEQEAERKYRDQSEAALKGAVERYVNEIAILKENHNREVRDLEQRHQASLNDASRRYQDDIVRRDSDSARERERVQGESIKERDRMKEAYEARIADLKTSQERELKAVQADRDREIASIRASYDMTTNFTKETSKTRSDALGDEVNRLRAEAERLRTENDKLVRASHKDPVQYLTETRMVATEMLGMVPAGEARAAGGEEEEGGEFNWKKEGAKAVMGLIQKLPETVKGATEAVVQMRAQNAQNQAAAEQMQAQAQAQGRGGRRRLAPTPQLWGGGSPPPYMGPVHGAEIPFQQPFQALQHQPLQGPPAGPMLPNPSQFMVGNVDPVGMQQPQPQAPQPQQMQQAPQQSVQQQQQPSQQQTQVQVTQDGMELFISELDGAIRGETITPDMFAVGLVNSIGGKEQAAALLKEMSAEAFLGRLDAAGHGGSITTRTGRAYVVALWKKVAEIAAS